MKLIVNNSLSPPSLEDFGQKLHKIEGSFLKDGNMYIVYDIS